MAKNHYRARDLLVPEHGYCNLSDVSPKDKVWDMHRANALHVEDLYRLLGYDRLADRIHDCSRRLEFASVDIDPKNKKFKLQSARFCRVRHCPVCQWRRCMMWRARFIKSLPKILENHPSCRFIFLTLTVRNCPVEELRENILWMNKSWKNMTKRKIFPALGWVKSVEVTKGRDSLAHPHFHAVLMVSPSYFTGRGYLSHEKWLETWRSCLKVDYDPSIKIKAIQAKFGSSEDESVRGLNLLDKSLLETLKYSVKESDLLDDTYWLQQLTNQLHKTRSVSLGGVFKKYLSEKEPENLVNSGLEEDELSEDSPRFMFEWKELVKKYQSM